MLDSIRKNLWKKNPGRRMISRVFLSTLLSLISVIASSQSVKELLVSHQITLNARLSEISGMAYSDGLIYAINDSGKGSTIFTLNSSDGKLLSRYRIEQLKNYDWEELSLFNNYLYIGDFGNNRGDRKNQAVHKIHIDELSALWPDIQTTGISYASQVDYSRKTFRHSWDCEAMVVNENGIYCFSKDWKEKKTKLYMAEPGKNNNLQAIDSFDVSMLVSGAFYDKERELLILCGYLDHETYIWIFNNASSISFTGDAQKYKIPELKNTQVESVFVHKEYIYLGSERTVKAQAIYKVLLPVEDEE